MRFNHLTVIHLRLFNRKNSLGAGGFGLKWTRVTFAVNSFSGSGNAVVVSNCHQLAWISSVSWSRKLSLRLEEMAEIQASSQSPIFFLMAIAAVKVFWVSLCPVSKSLVMWISPTGIPKTMILFLKRKLVRAKSIWEITFAICLTANPNARC